jgi:hypothetical protein
MTKARSRSRSCLTGREIARALQARPDVLSVWVEGLIQVSSIPIILQPQSAPLVVGHNLKQRRLMKFAAIAPLALALTLGLVGPALAKRDRPGADWISAEQVKQKLTDAGYTSITELEADDGHWEGEGMKNGVKMEFHVDPRTGVLTKEKPDKD